MGAAITKNSQTPTEPSVVSAVAAAGSSTNGRRTAPARARRQNTQLHFLAHIIRASARAAMALAAATPTNPRIAGAPAPVSADSAELPPPRPTSPR